MARRDWARRGGAGQGEAGITNKGDNDMKLDFRELVLDRSIYPRSSVSEVNVARLMAALQTGVKLPPIIVDAATKRVVDGWHRYEVYKRLKTDFVNATLKTYASEAELFSDAVRLNVSHGEPLDVFSVHNAIIRLEEYGYSRERISEIVRLPATKIEKIERGFAADEKGKPVAVKGGLSHLGGSMLTDEQIEVNRRYSGTKTLFHLRQLCALIENDMYPRTQDFAHEMDRLIGLWAAISKAAA